MGGGYQRQISSTSSLEEASNHLDADMSARGAGEASVAREQRHIERLGESDIDGVMRGEIAPQFPDTLQKEVVAITAERKIGENGERRPTALRVHLADHRIAANDMRYLDVEQVRGVQCLAAIQ